jgi:hypothetical protein
MTISETTKVDLIFLDPDTNEVILVISDHLDWAEEVNEHLLLLQEKLNAYLRFSESGEIFREVPLAIGRKIVFQVVGQYPLTSAARAFFKEADDAIRAAGFKLSFRYLKSGSSRDQKKI